MINPGVPDPNESYYCLNKKKNEIRIQILFKKKFGENPAAIFEYKGMYWAGPIPMANNPILASPETETRQGWKQLELPS